jgi:hypothetical protein
MTVGKVFTVRITHASSRIQLLIVEVTPEKSLYLTSLLPTSQLTERD